MEWILIIPVGLVVGFLIFGVAFAKIVLDNIGIILLAIGILIVLMVLLCKWPKQTIITLAASAVIFTIYFTNTAKKAEESIPVTIYKASDTCTVYDKNDRIVVIPEGAIVARYVDERERQAENHNVFGFVNVCYWYYNGDTSQFFVSNSHELSQQSNLEPNDWNLTKIEEITYGEFQKGSWKKQ